MTTAPMPSSASASFRNSSNLAHQLEVQGVQHLGTIQGNDGNPIHLVGGDNLKGHDCEDSFAVRRERRGACASVLPRV